MWPRTTWNSIIDELEDKKRMIGDDIWNLVSDEPWRDITTFVRTTREKIKDDHD